MIPKCSTIPSPPQPFCRSWICKIEANFVDKLRLVAICVDFTTHGVELCDLVVVSSQIAGPAHWRLEIAQADMRYQRRPRVAFGPNIVQIEAHFISAKNIRQIASPALCSRSKY